MDDKLDAYNKRYNNWSDKVHNQFSFFNNLLLTIGIGFISYNFGSKSFEKLHISFININWSTTFEVFSIIFMLLSITYGIIVVITRLYDFRLTRHITLTRYRVYKRNNGKLLSENTSSRRSFWQRIFILYKKIYYIKIEDCKNYIKQKEKFDKDFNNLREISFNLGIKSWDYTVIQSLTLVFSIIFFVISLIL